MVAKRMVGRFAVEVGLTCLFLMLGLWVFIPALLEGSLGWKEAAILAAGLVALASALLSIISLPKVSEAEFTVSYGPIHRRIDPSRVERIYRSITGRYVIRESGRIVSYNFSCQAYRNGREIEAAMCRWAAVNGIKLDA